jgi:peptidyl-prolyl cis-trans isomerase SurA
MIKKNLFIYIIIFYQIIFLNLSFSKINIVANVNNKIITNYDVIKESNYLKLLNPNLENLKNEEIFEIAKRSIINEKIKIEELSKLIDLNEENEIAENYFKDFLLKIKNDYNLNLEDNLKNNNIYNLNEIKYKTKVELYWNDLIFNKYINRININEKKIEEKINQLAENQNKEIFLSEIVFKKKSDQELESLLKEIEESILNIGFNNTANLYSLSESSKLGGKIGWIKEDMLSEDLRKIIKQLNVNDISNLIKIDNNFVLIKIEDIRSVNREIDKNKEFQKLIAIERNKKLENFSRIHFNKIKTNYIINER